MEPTDETNSIAPCLQISSAGSISPLSPEFLYWPFLRAGERRIDIIAPSSSIIHPYPEVSYDATKDSAPRGPKAIFCWYYCVAGAAYIYQRASSADPPPHHLPTTTPACVQLQPPKSQLEEDTASLLLRLYTAHPLFQLRSREPRRDAGGQTAPPPLVCQQPSIDLFFVAVSNIYTRIRGGRTNQTEETYQKMEAPLSSPTVNGPSQTHPSYFKPSTSNSTLSSSRTQSQTSTASTSNAQTQPHQATAQNQPQAHPQSQFHVPQQSAEPFLRDFNLVAEAAKRAQMAVLMRDMESVGI